MAKQADVFPITSEPVELTAAERRLIEAQIQKYMDAAEALIATLDAADGDPDLEWDAGEQPEQDAGDEGEAGADDDLSCDDLIGGRPQAL